MSVKTQALDRLIEAISPGLEAQLDRVVQETQEVLEQEFETRLQAAVRDAEIAAASTAQSQLERAVEQARDDTRRQVTAEMEKQFQEKLEAATTQIKNESSAELSKVEDALKQWRTFAETQQQLAEAPSQSEILSRFLKLAQPFSQGLAVYVVKADGLALWKGSGKGAFPEIISRESTDPESFFRIISVRGKTVGAVCAMPAFNADALDFLAGSLERAVEAFGLKLRTPIPKPAAKDK